MVAMLPTGTLHWNVNTYNCDNDVNLLKDNFMRFSELSVPLIYILTELLGYASLS